MRLGKRAFESMMQMKRIDMQALTPPLTSFLGESVSATADPICRWPRHYLPVGRRLPSVSAAKTNLPLLSD